MSYGTRQEGAGASGRGAPAARGGRGGGALRDAKPVSFRPVAYRNLAARKNLWADYVTGRGVLDNGQIVPPKIGPRRKNPNLTDMLDTAAAVGVDRIMFTGKVPTVTPGKRHWLLVQTPGWVAAGHHTGSPATGRFEHRQTGKKMLVQFAAGWFGDASLTPDQARLAFQATGNVIGAFFRDAKLMDTPTATGANLWALSLPRNLEPYPLTEDIAEELHRTSGQHHVEHLVAGPSSGAHPDCIPLHDPGKTPKIAGFAYVDGRFMYGAMCRELGIGPGERLRREDTADMLREDPYARARVLVRFKVPDTWEHIGLFGVQHERASDGWYWPNRPGATGQTWVDAAEFHVAARQGWQLDPLESVRFTTKVPGARDRDRRVAARPLDTWQKNLSEARAAVAADPLMDPVIKTAVSAALRSILINTIGNFAARGRDQTHIVFDPKEVPPTARDVRQQGNAFLWTTKANFDAQASRYYHPELAVQVWGRARARMLSGPMAEGMEGGALHVPANTLLGVRGDAIYTTQVPKWALPVEHGGGDDGKVGRMRLQGHVPGPLKIPEDETARNRLRAKAARLGVDAAFLEYEMQAAPVDDAAAYLAGDEEDTAAAAAAGEGAEA